MLIHLDATAAADAASAGPTAERSHAAIENLLLARFEGKHALSLRPEDASALRAARWSRRAARALDAIDADFAEVGRFRKHVSWSLELGLGSAFDGRAHDVAPGRRIIRASLHSFAPSDTTRRAALLGESPHDADLFVHLALMRRAARGWGGVEVAHEARGTGGDTFAPEFQRVADVGQIVLAIADSDRRHPRSPCGATFHKLEIAAQGRPAYQRARPLHTRTAEALVPLGVYREVFQAKNGDQRLGIVARLEQLIRSSPADVLRYAHLKRGITLRQIEERGEEAEGSDWRDVAQKARRDQCTQPSDRQCAKPEDCRCYVVDRLGDGALAAVIDWVRSRPSKRDLARRFDLAGDADLSALADEILSFGLAFPPLAT